jgi:hypothetical protein
MKLGYAYVMIHSNVSGQKLGYAYVMIHSHLPSVEVGHELKILLLLLAYVMIRLFLCYDCLRL